MRKKTLILFLCGAFAAGILAGCGAADEPGTVSAEEETADTSQNSTEEEEVSEVPDTVSDTVSDTASDSMGDSDLETDRVLGSAVAVDMSETVDIYGDPATFDISQLKEFDYNGCTYELPIDYALFTDDGWTHDYESYQEEYVDGQYSFIYLENPSYDSGIWGRFFGNTLGGSSLTEEELETDGVYGFEISIPSGCEYYPAVSVGGVSFGDSSKNVIEAFGEPTLMTWGEEGTYTNYYYQAKSGDATYSLKFSTDEANGVYAIQLRNSQVSYGED